MSEARGDCEHGHGAEVLELARLIGLDHNVKSVLGAALVLIPEGETPFVIGKFNTRALWQMAGQLLVECAKHEPDGCAMCDPSALAAKDAFDTLMRRYDHHRVQHTKARL